MTSPSSSIFPSYPRSSIIYLSCVGFLVASLASLPYLKTDVSVHASALIRPAAEMNTIRSISSGRVKETYAAENKKVKEGDLLYLIESETLNEQEKYNREKIAIKETFIRDVQSVIIATKDEGNPTPPLINALYRQAYFAYRQKIDEAQTQFTKARQAYDRQYKLYKLEVIAAMEFENFQFELKKAENAIAQIKESQRSQWQNELKNIQDEKRELESQLVRVQRDKSLMMIKAPLSGTLQNLSGVYNGSLVFANQELGQISPDTSLLVIAHVQPNDIGFIRKNMDVRIQIDAFNYNQWGMAKGKVMAVPQDIKLIDNKPVFEVRCSLDQDFLQLHNGYKGYLKKGMTSKARFIVARRSLWQLLYDKADNWMNPNL